MRAMQSNDVIAFFAQLIEESREAYVQDLEAMSEEQVSRAPGGTARSGLDFTYEVVVVNQRIAARLRGEEPAPWPFESWVTAPEGWSRDQAVQAIRDSMNEALEAWKAVDPEKVFQPLVEDKPGTRPASFAFMVAHHAGYHDAQLNYLQSLAGDQEVHWK